jgi:hypothetical protein
MGDKEDIIAFLELYGIVKDFHEFIDSSDLDEAFRRITGVLGFQWENEFISECKSRNIPCVPADSQSLPYDCVANGNKRVQCKSTSYTNRIDIRSKKKDSNRRYDVTDFDVMAVRILSPHKKDFFFIPVSDLVDEGVMLKSGIALQDYENCRNAWHNLAA